MPEPKSKTNFHTILVVDDDKSVIDSFDVMLSDSYNVIGVETGEDAINLIQEQAIDLILLDIKLPGINGMEVLKQIKKIDPNAQVAMVTAMGTTGTVPMARPESASAERRSNRRRRQRAERLQPEFVNNPVRCEELS